jgi:hypothetical protein
LREEHRLRMFGNMVLRSILRPRRDEVTGELYDVHSPQNIIHMIKSRRMRWVGHVACMRQGRCIQGFW